MSFQNEIKSIKLLQDKAKNVSSSHNEISNELEEIKALLKNDKAFCTEGIEKDVDIEKDKIYTSMSKEKELKSTLISQIYNEANMSYKENLVLTNILTPKDLIHCQYKYNHYIEDFNKRYSLDAWDYAIATSCGLFAAMLDILFVSAPLKSTVSYNTKVNGTFNQWVQSAFNKIIPPDLSESLSKSNNIGSADVSMTKFLKTDTLKVLNPQNHRLKGLAHDPVLGVIFGVLDMINNTCTVVHDGKIQVFDTIRDSMPDENIFYKIGRMFGHLLSDVNAPTANENRGMGLPAPFMGLLRMFDSIEVPKSFNSSETSTFGKQIEWMYVNGYDFRQFLATSIPMTIMEVLLRVFYTIKQIKVHNATFGETMLDTMPLNLNPRFRIILAIAYGTSSSINAGKVYITKNLLNANYASWMGFTWNSFHSLKWLAYDRQNKLYDEILENEINEIEKIVEKIEHIGERIKKLPI